MNKFYILNRKSSTIDESKSAMDNESLINFDDCSVKVSEDENILSKDLPVQKTSNVPGLSDATSEVAVKRSCSVNHLNSSHVSHPDESETDKENSTPPNIKPFNIASPCEVTAQKLLPNISVSQNVLESKCNKKLLTDLHQQTNLSNSHLHSSSSKNLDTIGSEEQLLSVSRCISPIRRAEHVNRNLDSCEVHDNLVKCEKRFYNYPLLQNGFALKLDEKKLKAYNLWLKCIEYQYYTGNRKSDKKNAIVKLFVKKDKVFNLTVQERKDFSAKLGISYVKETALKIFQIELENYLNSQAYRNFQSSKKLRRFSKVACSNVIQNRAHKTSFNSNETFCLSSTRNIIESDKTNEDKLLMNSFAQYSSSKMPSTSVVEEKMNYKQPSTSHAASFLSQSHRDSSESVQHQNKTLTNVSENYSSSCKPNTSDSNEQLLNVSRSVSGMNLAQKVNNSHSDYDEINNNNLQSYEQIFYKHVLTQERLALKLDEKKLKAYNLWLKCVGYQYYTGNRKTDKKNSIVKMFVKKDKVFNLSVKQRNEIVELGINHVKETAFKLFQIEFVAFVKSPAYKNMRK